MLRSTHDNWEKLVAAVLKRELYLRLCHQDSIDSTLSDSSSFISSFRSSFSSHDAANFNHEKPENRVFISPNSLPFKALYRFKLYPEEDKLILTVDSPFTFGLRELLSAPSTVLGDIISTFDTTFLVSLRHDLWILVVKRLELGSATPSNVVKRLKRFAGIDHDNVVKLRAYYVSTSDAFGMFDYMPRGSVHSMLHGNRGGVGRLYLSWDARTEAAIGVAMGLAHIHGRGLYHGNVKASNIFLDSNNFGCIGEPCISEYHDSSYLPPEVSVSRLSRESDVYRFGVLLIELISGKSATLYKAQYYVEWALHNGRDEVSALVFDKQMLKDPLAKQEIWKVYGVAMKCLDKSPEKRPKMEDVVLMLSS